MDWSRDYAAPATRLRQGPGHAHGRGAGQMPGQVPRVADPHQLAHESGICLVPTHHPRAFGQEFFDGGIVHPAASEEGGPIPAGLRQALDPINLIMRNSRGIGATVFQDVHDALPAIALDRLSAVEKADRFPFADLEIRSGTGSATACSRSTANNFSASLCVARGWIAL